LNAHSHITTHAMHCVVTIYIPPPPHKCKAVSNIGTYNFLGSSQDLAALRKTVAAEHEFKGLLKYKSHLHIDASRCYRNKEPTKLIVFLNTNGRSKYRTVHKFEKKLKKKKKTTEFSTCFEIRQVMNLLTEGWRVCKATTITNRLV
jgi:hypothetical protein